jgi:hypothetical protein
MNSLRMKCVLIIDNFAGVWIEASETETRLEEKDGGAYHHHSSGLRR